MISTNTTLTTLKTKYIREIKITHDQKNHYHVSSHLNFTHRRNSKAGLELNPICRKSHNLEDLVVQLVVQKE